MVYSVVCWSCSGRKNYPPELLMAANHGGPGVTYLCFYRDSTVVFMPGMFSNEIEGTYQLRDSVFIVKGIPLGGYIHSDRFLLTRKHPLNSNWSEKLIVQVDSTLKIADSIHVLPVDRDWRDSASYIRSAKQ